MKIEWTDQEVMLVIILIHYKKIECQYIQEITFR